MFVGCELRRVGVVTETSFVVRGIERT